MKGSSLAQVAPRRRLRASPTSFPNVDLIGPPCPLSNLRPVYYAPLFPSLPPTLPFTSLPTGAPHPYSLSEFPLASSSSSLRSDARLARLARVQQELHAKDLEWRLTRYRLDAFNQDFWSRTNADFLREKEKYLVEHRSSKGMESDVDLAMFYKEHLQRTKKVYAAYNAQLWKMQAALLWPALKAVWRPYKWRWELWRAVSDAPVYLQPDWDPTKVKVSELRSILLQHHIPYQSSWKKPEFVAAFNAAIKPRAEALLRQHQVVRPSDEGILDGESQGSSLAELDTDSGSEADEAPPVVEKKKKDKVRTKKPVKKAEASDEEDDVEPPPRKLAKKVSLAPPEASTSKTSPAKRRAGSTGPQEEEHHKRAKPDLSTPTASNKKDRRFSLYEAEGGGFSDYNPFQSGNEDSPDKVKRRKSSMGPTRTPFIPKSTTPGAGRKSVPAQMPSSATRVGTWLDDTQDVNSSPAVHSRLTGHPPPPSPAPGPSTPNTASFNKFMVPVDSVKRSPPELEKLQRELGLYQSQTPPQKSHAMDEDEFDVNQDVALDELEEQFRWQNDETGKTTKAKSPAPSPRPFATNPAAHLKWEEGAPSSKAIQGLRNEIRKTPAPKPKAGHVVGTGRRSMSGTPVSRVASSLNLREYPTPVDSEDDFDADQSTVLTPVYSAARPASRFSFYSVILFSIVYLLWWREERVATGFCDTATSNNALVRARDATRSLSLAVDQLPSLPPRLLATLDSLHLRPSCTPCPAHATCTDGSFMGCAPEYVASQHPLSFGGLIPLAPRCSPDTEKLMAVAVQAAKAARSLRRRKGEVICGGLEKSRRKAKKSEAWVYGISAEQLMESLRDDNENAGSPYPEDVLDDISRLAILDLKSHGEVISAEENGAIWLAAQTADMSLSCRARRSVIEHAIRHQTALATMLALVVLSLWLRAKLLAGRAENEQVKKLVKTVYHQLRTQERLHYNDPALAPNAHIAPSHLRDLVLQSEHSPVKRQQLWKKVESVVESNSNVRAKEVEMDGEPIRAWLWNGISAVEEEDGGEEKKEGKKLYPKLE
ncbi:inner nuclear membrane protein MAN1 [Pseudohyphozyma bogoriensis]|nr:inner nuclear membrane protein MAN1 [Pseudohyphozyma bogoriensis]